MQQPEVLKLFRVDNYKPGSSWGNWRWTGCNMADGWKLKSTYQSTELDANTKEQFAEMLNDNKDLKVLIYNGEYDFQINYIGLEKVIKDINWKGNSQMFERSNGAYTEWTYRNLTSGKT